MVALAVSNEDGILVSDVEMEKTGPSYTVETLDALASRGELSTATLHFIIGADAFRDVPSWRAYPDVLDRSHFIVVSRPGLSVDALPTALPELAPRMTKTPCIAPSTPGIFLVDALTAPVSSTDVRRRIRARESVATLVPEAVERYIAKHRLYVDERETRQG
jgi:nicotinate-nucleotide adenylyltransferase